MLAAFADRAATRAGDACGLLWRSGMLANHAWGVFRRTRVPVEKVCGLSPRRGGLDLVGLEPLFATCMPRFACLEPLSATWWPRSRRPRAFVCDVHVQFVGLEPLSTTWTASHKGMRPLQRGRGVDGKGPWGFSPRLDMGNFRTTRYFSEAAWSARKAQGFCSGASRSREPDTDGYQGCIGLTISLQQRG